MSELLLGKAFSGSEGIKINVHRKSFEFLPIRAKSRIKISPKKEYKEFILKNANSIWSNARNKKTNEIGVVWNRSPLKADASRQSSALDAFNAAMIVTK